MLIMTYEVYCSIESHFSVRDVNPTCSYSLYLEALMKLGVFFLYFTFINGETNKNGGEADSCSGKIQTSLDCEEESKLYELSPLYELPVCGETPLQSFLLLRGKVCRQHLLFCSLRNIIFSNTLMHSHCT